MKLKTLSAVIGATTVIAFTGLAQAATQVQ